MSALTERAKQIMREIDISCNCGASPHSPDCNFERAAEDAWDQAKEELYDEAQVGLRGYPVDINGVDILAASDIQDHALRALRRGISTNLILHGVEVPAHKYAHLSRLCDIVYGRMPMDDSIEAAQRMDAVAIAIVVDRMIDQMVKP